MSGKRRFRASRRRAWRMLTVYETRRLSGESERAERAARELLSADVADWDHDRWLFAGREFAALQFRWEWSSFFALMVVEAGNVYGDAAARAVVHAFGRAGLRPRALVGME